MQPSHLLVSLLFWGMVRIKLRLSFLPVFAYPWISTKILEMVDPQPQMIFDAVASV